MINKRIKKKKNQNNNNTISLLNDFRQNFIELQLKYNSLKQENSDLKQNLQINKEIINSFFKNIPTKKLYNDFNSKIIEENQILYQQIEKLSNENKKLLEIENNLNYYKNELDIAKGKIFIFENILKQKENIIKDLKRKTLIKRKENDKEDKILKQTIYVTSPKFALNKINDTLYTYKEINQRLTTHIRALKDTLLRKNLEIQKKTGELYKCQNEIKEFKLQKNNAAIIQKLNILNGLSTSKTNNSFCYKSLNFPLNDSSNSSNSNSNQSKKISKRKQSIYDEIKRLEEIKKTTKEISEKEFDLTSEWFEALKSCHITQEEYANYCKDNSISKLTDLIEYLYKYVIDKNIQIKLIENENEELNLENLKLNKENIDLSEEYEKIKKNDNNSIFVNVDNNISHNNININMMMDYMKEVQKSVSSTDFMDGLIFDQLDFSDGNINKNNNFHIDSFDLPELSENSYFDKNYMKSQSVYIISPRTKTKCTLMNKK